MQILNILVRTKAGKSEFSGFDPVKNAYRVSVKASPEHGEANLEVVKVLHREFKLPVRIMSGFKSKEKKVQIG
ncbi:MAG TPA: DUF167 domain-containing protein [Nanoarchaeota archaeon]|nr:DUF167 domain-containing protein [Nanoarchaeota archaeon]